MDYDTIIMGSGAGNGRDKSLAQHMEAHQADGRDFSRRISAKPHTRESTCQRIMM
jgi:hypothetical protein